MLCKTRKKSDLSIVDKNTEGLSNSESLNENKGRISRDSHLIKEMKKANEANEA